MPWDHRNTFPHSRTIRWILSATPLTAIGLVLVWIGFVWRGIGLIIGALFFCRWWELRKP